MSETDQTSKTTNTARPQVIRNKRDLRLAANDYLRLLQVRPPPPRPNAAAPTPPSGGNPGAAPGSLRPDWSGGITIKKALKGDADKKTCIIEVGGQDYVLKGAPKTTYFAPGQPRVDRDDRSTSADNAAAADLIRTLALPGVRVPQSRAPDATEKAAVIAALTATVQAGGNMAADARELLQALQQGEVQLSEVDTGGIDSAKIFIRKDVALARQASCDVRKQVLADPATGWETAFDRFMEVASYKSQWAKYKGETDPAKRQAAIALIRKDETSGRVLEYVKVLEEIIGGSVTAGLATANKEISDRQAHRADLQAFAKSREGIAAYAGVAAADLITGMEDRIMNWNGGNFMFDPASQELACVDNNKQPEQGLTETARPQAWTTFFEGVVKFDPDPVRDENGTTYKMQASLADVIFDKLYKSDGADPDRPAEMPGFPLDPAGEAAAKKIIRDTLDSVVAKLKAPALNGTPAGKRGAALGTLLELQDILAVPPGLACSGSAAPELDAGDKILRGLRSTPGSWFSEATKIKDNLRKNPTSFAAARAALAALIRKHPKNSADGGDRLATNITYYATACEFGTWLRGAAAQVRNKPKPTPPESPWTIFGDLCKLPLAAADAWLVNVGGEQQIASLIQTGKDELQTAGT